MTYFHGGLPGRGRGSFLLPPSLTKVRSMSELGAVGVHRKDRVYVTTSRDAALMFACAWPRGVIYEVEPIGAIEPDPDCDLAGLSWQCEKARIVRVHKVRPADMDLARSALMEP